MTMGPLFSPRRSLVAAVHVAADGGGHPRALSGAHVGVEDVLLGDDVVVRPRVALERHRPAAKPVRGHPAGCVSVFGVRSSRSTSPRNAAPILRPASSAYSRSISAPTKKWPSSLAATPVVPDPQNGSKTSSPSILEASTARRRSRRGFWVGWRPWDFSLMGTAGMCQTEESWEVGSGPFMRS